MATATTPQTTDPATAPGPPEITVVIPVFNDPERLALCLDALREQTLDPARFDVLVVDDGSDEPIDALIARYDRVRLIRTDDEVGGSYAARNRAIAATAAPILAFTDADCVPRPDWLACGLHALDAADHDALVAGDIELFYPAGRPINGAQVFDRVTAFPQREYVELDRFAVTANLFVPRRVFDRVGRFDGSAMSGGDREFGRRATDAGVRLVFEPAAVVDHPTRGDAAVLRAKWRRVARGVERIRRENPDAPEARRAGLWRSFRPRLRFMAGIVADRSLGPLSARLSACWLVVQHRPMAWYYARQARRLSDRDIIGRG
ncbi:MAG: glycosyltransferase [Planctomycetota bacterium]